MKILKMPCPVVSFSVKSFSLLIAGIFILFSSHGQIVINEFSSNNQSYISDEEGDFEDWIELYNSGTSAVNLNGYSLIDLKPAPSQWIFPDYVLLPGKYLLVYASGKNKRQVLHHWETAVCETMVWKYLVPDTEPPAEWRTSLFDDSSWNSGKGGIGYGDKDDSTVIAPPVNAVYMRKTFTIDDTSKLLRGILHIDYDDGFIAFLNGVEIARANLTGKLPAYNNSSEVEHEAKVYAGGAYEKYEIDSLLLKSALVNGTNVLSVQVYNSNPSSSDLSARVFLSFGIKDETIQFSAVPGWFHESNSSFHTNFKLSNNGDEAIYLINNLGVRVDNQEVPSLNINHSYGRSSDGSNQFAYFNLPSPGSANVPDLAYIGYCSDSLIFSLESGFYSGTQTLQISGASSIRYTLDGSDPSLFSMLYSNPIVLTSTTVVRAACMSASMLPRKIFTNTYFINESTKLPVISLSTAPANFFDTMTGIYVLGPNADSVNIPYFGANFWQDWERPVYVEYYDPDKKLCFEQQAGVRIYGNYSRSNPMKSLLIFARDEYGKSEFDYEFYKNKNIKSFKSFVLRNSGNDFNTTQIKDPLNQLAVFKNTSIDIQAYQPCVVYINGKYWGIHQIREKINEYYVSDNYGIDKDLVDITDAWGAQIEGSSNIWSLWWRATNTDLSNSFYFKQVADSFDLKNLTDYFAAQIYISNWDWPTNNLKLWRSKGLDGKFRYIFWDTDISLGVWNLQPASYNQLERIKNASSLSAGPHAEIFSNMLKNKDFRNYFINRSADLINTIYRPSKFAALANSLRDEIASEMPRHLARWSGSIGYWNSSTQQMMDFIYSRPGYARKQMLTAFALTDTVSITLKVSPAGAGIIKINTVYPDAYPWTGVYFNGVPVTITAIPNPGYKFYSWQAAKLITNPNLNASLTLNVTLNETFTANFTGSSNPLTFTVSEFNYHSPDTLDSGDWIELYNYGSASASISGWVFRDYNDYHSYVFPANTVIPPGGRLVVCSDPLKFHAVYPSVTNYIGPFDFTLDNDEDMIRIFDFLGNEYLHIEYKDQYPWDSRADGKGYTLENIQISTVNDPATWQVGCVNGSPGTGYLPACITSVKGQISTVPFSLYPNPTKGTIRLQLENTSFNVSAYEVTNSVGKLVFKETVESGISSFTMDLSGQPAGIYHFLMYTEEGLFSQKLIKE